MPSIMSPEMQKFKEEKDHEDYNDLLRKKQALMSIPGLNLAQLDEDSIADLELSHFAF